MPMPSNRTALAISFKGGIFLKFNERKEMIFHFIEDYYSKNGIPPTVREIGKGVGLSSPGTVKLHIDNLIAEGRLISTPNKSRSLMPAKFNFSVQVPIVGKVAAGMPIFAEGNYLGNVPFYSSGKYYSEDELFALSIKGESMVNAGILNGDIVIVKKTPVARDGEIVIALIEDDATCKRFYRSEDKIVLKPENPEYNDIIVDKADILGKVISVMRYY